MIGELSIFGGAIAAAAWMLFWLWRETGRPITFEARTEQSKILDDLAIHGTGVYQVRADGSVRHIPLSEFYLTGDPNETPPSAAAPGAQ